MSPASSWSAIAGIAFLAGLFVAAVYLVAVVEAKTEARQIRQELREKLHSERLRVRAGQTELGAAREAFRRKGAA